MGDEVLYDPDGGCLCADCSVTAQGEERIARGNVRRRWKLGLVGLGLVLTLCVFGWWRLRPLPAVRAYWSLDSLVFEGAEARGAASVEGMNYVVTLQVPAGTHIDIDGQRLVTAGTWRYAMDRTEVLRDTPLVDLLRTGVGVETTLTVKLPRRPANELSLPAVTELRSVGRQLRRVTQGEPFLFADEPADQGAKPTVLLLQSDALRSDNIVGAGATLGTIYFVAFPGEPTTVKGQVCAGRPTKQQQARLSVYDRRDARLVIEGIVRAEQSCPPGAEEDPFAEPVIHALRRSDYLAWLRDHHADIH